MILFFESFSLVGPRLISQTVDAGLGAYRARVTFNVPMDPSTFTLDEIPSFLGPSGSVPVLGVIPVLDSNFTQFDIVFAPLTESGAYSMIVGPDIRDRLGNSMGGTYALNFTVGGPRALASSPAGNVLTSVDHIRLVFNYPIDANSFTIDQVIGFTGPGGDIPVNAVDAVPFTNNTQFDVQFDRQSDPGSYVMAIDASIRDSYGNNLDAPYAAEFTVIDTGGGRPTTGAHAATHFAVLVQPGPSASSASPSASNSDVSAPSVALRQPTVAGEIPKAKPPSVSGKRLPFLPLVSVLDDDLGYNSRQVSLASGNSGIHPSPSTECVTCRPRSLSFWRRVRRANPSKRAARSWFPFFQTSSQWRNTLLLRSKSTGSACLAHDVGAAPYEPL